MTTPRERIETIENKFPRAKCFRGEVSRLSNPKNINSFTSIEATHNRGWRLDALVDWVEGDLKVNVGKKLYRKVFSKYSEGDAYYMGWVTEIYASSKKEAGKLRRFIKTFPEIEKYII